MRLGVPAETYPGERRVAMTPAAANRLRDVFEEIVVESGAGGEAGFADAAYASARVRLASREEVFACEVVGQVRTFAANPREGRRDLELSRSGQVIVGFASPLASRDALELVAERGVALFALELVPRTSRAQVMDALTSMATLAGYKAVLLAAAALSRMFPMMVTAAGTLAPARVLVLGAGVAGLQAIATARRLGAVVTAYDVRPAVREEIESLGARFAELPLETSESEDERGYARGLGEDFYRRQREHMAELVRDADVVVTTAAVPGKEAPRLLTREMVEEMGRGAVVVDLAAAFGGNCELTRPDETVDHGGVTLLGPTDLAATLPFHASQMYARNLAAFLDNLVRDGAVRSPEEDDVLRETLVTRDGAIVHPALRDRPAEEE